MIKLWGRKKKRKICPEAMNKLQSEHDANRKRTDTLVDEMEQTMTNLSKHRVKHS